MTGPRTAVYMLVRNECVNDARVLKEAEALAQRGMRVTIVAVQRGQTAPVEQRGPVTIVRVPIRPLHYRILRWYRSLPGLEALVGRRERMTRIAELRRQRQRAVRDRTLVAAAERRERERELRDRRSTERSAIRRRERAGAPLAVDASLIGRARNPLGHPMPSLARRSNLAFARGVASRRLRELSARAAIARGRNDLGPGSLAIPQLVLPLAPRPELGRVSDRAALRLAQVEDRIRAVTGRVARAADPMARLDARLRLVSYEALKWTLMRGHREFLLADYSARALRAIESDLGPIACGEREAVVIHAHDLNTLLPGALAKRRFRGPLVYDSHELQMGTTAMVLRGPVHRRLYRRYERALSRRADAVITVCDSIARILERDYGIQRVDVVRNCALLVPPIEHEDLLRRELGIPAERRIALYHGNLTTGRGLEVLVESARFMPSVDVVLLGSGPLFAELPKLADRCGVGERLHVLAAVSQALLHRFVASADVAVVPIQAVIPNYFYSLPNKLFEALVAGLPIAASHLPEIRRVVEGERVGAIFDPEDPRDVARAITEILESPDYGQMRERALEAARERHHWALEVRRLTAVYDRIGAGIT